MARPTKWSEERAKAIISALAAGNTRPAAAAYAGVSDQTLANWIRRNLGNLADLVSKAEADAEVRHVANIAKAANDGTWTASAWWLERRRHDEWGRKDKIEVILRREAEQIANHLGVPVDEVIARAEAIANGRV